MVELAEPGAPNVETDSRSDQEFVRADSQLNEFQDTLAEPSTVENYKRGPPPRPYQPRDRPPAHDDSPPVPNPVSLLSGDNRPLHQRHIDFSSKTDLGVKSSISSGYTGGSPYADAYAGLAAKAPDPSGFGLEQHIHYSDDSDIQATGSPNHAQTGVARCTSLTTKKSPQTSFERVSSGGETEAPSPSTPATDVDSQIPSEPGVHYDPLAKPQYETMPKIEEHQA
jgi:hypothetical protein